ncbi:MAG: isoleucine--tRNA ligase [Acholeplasmataceae bacterium]|nr:isoleucine--tRNA ligase [Acholeplasmataceae bacterium]
MGKDYKDTLLIMQTEFPMRANLPTKEPEIAKIWYDNNIYQKVIEKNKGRNTFILHDGPPYANGNIHIGHALNKILKDFIVRYKSMTGNYCPYIPGWDAHGLPIENALTKKLKINRKEMSVNEFRALCEKYALEQVEIQKEQFMRLGVLGDWEHPYITIAKEYEATQLEVFAKMVEKGLIFKGLKPVYWSPSSESALAEAEIEYYDKTSPSIYVAFKVIDGKNVVSSDSELVIWTTTPWTLPANLAICVHPLYTYVVLEHNERFFVVAEELVESFVKAVGFKEYNIVNKFVGKQLEYVTYRHPLNNKELPVILGEHVTLDTGTGLVHTAPGHGEEDFIVGREYNLDVLCPVDARGYMTEEAGEFSGLFYEEANEKIIEKLLQSNSLLAHSTVTHSYPHDWRTNKPVIFRATSQWFASIEALKEDMLKAVEEVNWIPAWGEIRMRNMIVDRKEWCISRQRAWGVPIPVFYTEKETAILDPEVIRHVAKIFREEGSNAWFTKEAKELLPPGYTHPDSPNGIFVKEMDTMDVWFDSGTSHHSAMLSLGFGYPADLYLEGSDQYRGWFNSSLSTGVAMTKKAPYKTVLTHGFVLDGEGRKMSKSFGNVIEPHQIIKEFGADILRLWVASVNYTADVRISNEMLKQVAEAYRKIRNTFRFLLGNLFDYDDEKDRVSYEQMPEIDQYMMNLLNECIDKVIHAYEEFAFDEVYRTIITYVTNDLSAFYFDFTKDILYIERADGLARRSIQTVFYANLNALMRLLTPIIPFTTEEVYLYVKDRKVDSVYLLSMPEVTKYPNSNELLTKYREFMDLRDDVLKALEVARNNKIIGKSLHAKVTLKPTPATVKLLNSLKVDLKTIFIVSEFVVTDEDIPGDEYNSGIIYVTAREGEVCSRCWQVVDKLDEDELCERCESIVKDLGVK